MFITEELTDKINKYVHSHFNDVGTITLETLKRPPGPRLFVVVYDSYLELIKEIEVSEVMEWVNQGTNEKESAVVQSVLIESPEKPKRNERTRKGRQSNQK